MFHPLRKSRNPSERPHCQKNYRPASRDLKRVASVSLSPIYAHFSETLDGLAVIRAMKETPRFVSQNEERVDRSVRSQFAGVAAAQWLEIRLQVMIANCMCL